MKPQQLCAKRSAVRANTFPVYSTNSRPACGPYKITVAFGANAVLIAYMSSPRERLIDARVRSGKSPNEVAESAGISIPNYYDLESKDSELFSVISLHELQKVCSVLEITTGDLFAASSPPASRRANRNLVFLADEIRRHLEAQKLSIADFEERAGWEVQDFLDDQKEARDWSIDCLRDVCRELGIDWLYFVDDPQLS